MDMGVALFVGALAIGIVWTVVWLRRRRFATRAFIEYAYLHWQCLLDPTAIANPAIAQRVAEIVKLLGPQYEPRSSSWSRLGLLDANHRAYVTQHIDASVEEPLDLEAYADAILLVELWVSHVSTPRIRAL
jgi:hypothetical protein